MEPPRVETCSKPPKHVFFALPNLPLPGPDTDSEDQSEYHKTPYLTILLFINKNRIYYTKLDLYKTRIYYIVMEFY